MISMIIVFLCAVLADRYPHHIEWFASVAVLVALISAVRYMRRNCWEKEND